MINLFWLNLSFIIVTKVESNPSLSQKIAPPFFFKATNWSQKSRTSFLFQASSLLDQYPQFLPSKSEIRYEADLISYLNFLYLLPGHPTCSRRLEQNTKCFLFSAIGGVWKKWYVTLHETMPKQQWVMIINYHIAANIDNNNMQKIRIHAWRIWQPRFNPYPLPRKLKIFKLSPLSVHFFVVVENGHYVYFIIYVLKKVLQSHVFLDTSFTWHIKNFFFNL